MINDEKLDKSIENFYRFLVSNIAFSSNNQYAGFILDLDRREKEKRLAIGGTSLGLILASYSDNKILDGHYQEKMYKFIISKQLEEGSWTISSLAKYNNSLIYTTCFAIQGLIRYSKEKNNCEFEIIKGIKWLLNNVNEDGGWGLTPMTKSHIHATAEAVFTLNLAKKYCQQNLDLIIESGIKWLISQKKNDLWLDNDKEDIFFTALAYRAIISSNNIHYINEVQDTRELLIDYFDKAKCYRQKIYYIPVDNGEGHIKEEVGVYEKAIIFNALSYLKDINIKNILEYQIKYFLNTQDSVGFWSCKENENQSAPVFFNTEIIIGIINFKKFFLNKKDFKSKRLYNFVCKRLLKSKLFLFIIILLIFAGLIHLLSTIVSFFNNKIIIDFFNNMIIVINQKYEKYSGLANFIAIAGVLISIVGILIKYFKKFKK